MQGRTEYGSIETVWVAGDGYGHVRVEMQRGDQGPVLLTPAQALELAQLLQDVARGAGLVGRVIDRT